MQFPVSQPGFQFRHGRDVEEALRLIAVHSALGQFNVAVKRAGSFGRQFHERVGQRRGTQKRTDEQASADHGFIVHQGRILLQVIQLVLARRCRQSNSPELLVMEEIMRAWDMFEIVDQEPLNMVALYFLNRCPAHPLGRRGIVPRRVLQDGFPMSRRCFVFQAHAHRLLIASAVSNNLIQRLGVPEI